MNPFKTYIGLFLYVLRLAGKGIANRPGYLLFAPVASIVMGLLGPIVAGMNLGMAGGFLVGFVQAMAASAVLFAARAIIEQRKLGEGDVGTAAFAFLGDVMTVFFTLWIASMLLSPVPILFAIVALALVVLPVFETVAFGAAGGFGLFVSAGRFFQRDWAAWLAGQIPLVAILAPTYLWSTVALGLVPLGFVPPSFQNLAHVVLDAIPSVFVLIGLVYRGILYLTLDGLSPRRRAEKFGGGTPVA